MNLGIRGKLVLVSLALIALAGIAAVATLEFRVRRVLEGAVEDELVRHASAFRAALTLDSPIPQRALEGDAKTRLMLRANTLAPVLARESQVRLTLIDASGRVLADSDVAATKLDDHSDRPEIIAARAGKIGRSRRMSATLQRELLYVAIPFDRLDGVVVRAARPLSAVNTLIRTFRIALLVASVIALLVALFMASLASQLVTRTLRDLVIGARALAEGKRRTALEIGSEDEIGTLATSVNRMAADTRRSLKTLAAERDRMQAVLEGMGEAVLSLDDKLRVRLANPAAHALLDMEDIDEKEPLPGALQVPALRDELERGLRKRQSMQVDDDSSANDDELAVEFSLPREDGTSRDVLARVTPLRTWRGLVLVMLDVTEQRRLETMRRDFVANVSHELRTPVAVMRASAEALLDGAIADAERGPRFADAIHRNAERLSRLIGDVLDLARIEAGAAPGVRAPSITTVVLQDAVEAALSSVQEQARERRQRLDNDVDDTVRVLSDPESLDQILVNLLANAIKYTPEGGSIAVCADRLNVEGQPPRVRLAVVDDGPGIAEEHHDRLFERFYRVDEGRSTDAGGTGLGLAIVKHLALAMGGEAGFSPNLPRGSQFWIVLDAPDDKTITPTTSL